MFMRGIGVVVQQGHGIAEFQHLCIELSSTVAVGAWS